MSKLEQSFRDICEAHNVETINVQFTTKPGLQWFTTYVHADRLCTSGTADTIGAALGSALTEMAVKRGEATDVALADEALPELVA